MRVVKSFWEWDCPLSPRPPDVSRFPGWEHAIPVEYKQLPHFCAIRTPLIYIFWIAANILLLWVFLSV